MSRVSTLRPGLLVGVTTRVTGNVSYERFDIENNHIAADGTERAVWETKRVVAVPDEFKRATEVRAKARNLIAGVCAQSSFGLLCPEAREADLFERLDQARALASEFNAGAGVTHIAINVIVGRVAQDDVEAVRAINGEVRELLGAMERGLKALDVQTVRDAADKARRLGSMLSEGAQSRVKGAIDAARAAARDIAKAGEAGAIAVDEATLARVRSARTAFLDLDEGQEREVAAPVVAGRALDLGGEMDATVLGCAPAGSAPQVAFEF